MKIKTFDKTKYSEIMSFAAWQRIEKLIPYSHGNPYFTKHGAALMASIVIHLLKEKGYQANFIGNPQELYNDFIDMIEIQSQVKQFTLFIIYAPGFPLTLNQTHSEISVLNAGGQVINIRQIDDLLTYFDTNNL